MTANFCDRFGVPSVAADILLSRHPEPQAKDPRILSGVAMLRAESCMPELAYVYILASTFKRLYIGVTSDLMVRVAQHKRKAHPESFTARYSIDRLVYFERFTTITAAITREKELKGWLRQRKIALVVASNPRWTDLSAGWGETVDPFREASVRPPRRFGE